MTFQKVCTLDDIWEGDMASFDVGDTEILLAWPTGGELKAFQGQCPHQDISLAEGKLSGKVVMCRAHQWTFDAGTGNGLNPGNCRLAEYPLRIEGDDVLVQVEGVTPFYAVT